jgi:hypothetical protein
MKLSAAQCWHKAFINTLFAWWEYSQSTNYVFIDRRQHASILDVQLFTEAKCYTSHCRWLPQFVCFPLEYSIITLFHVLYDL